MRINLAFFAFFFLLSACNSNQKKNYFPFKSFLEKELHEIDSLPVAIFKYTERNNVLDTALVDKDVFREMSIALLGIDLEDNKTQNAYNELILEDTDIENIAITYSTENQQYPIKQLQLNVKSGTSLVKNFYVVRMEKLNEIAIQRKILWTTGKGVTITSIYYQDNIAKEQLIEKYNWSIQ